MIAIIVVTFLHTEAVEAVHHFFRNCLESV